MNHPVSRLSLCLLLARTLGGCLPADTRSPPAMLTLSVASDDAVQRGIPAETTADGWSIRYDRFLVVLGHGTLQGGGCDAYVEGEYARILDLLRPDPQHVNRLYGLGHCELGFSISPPAWDTLRGEGVSEDDELALRTPGSDSRSAGLGVSVWVEGSAERLDESRRFSWPFRRVIEYSRCELETADGVERELSLESHAVVEVEVSIRGTALFRESAEDDAAVRFESFRDADDVYGDADGVVTLAELESTPLTATPEKTLGELLYLELLPEIARYRGSGRCQQRATSEPDDFGGP